MSYELADALDARIIKNIRGPHRKREELDTIPAEDADGLLIGCGILELDDFRRRLCSDDGFIAQMLEPFVHVLTANLRDELVRLLVRKELVRLFRIFIQSDELLVFVAFSFFGLCRFFGPCCFSKGFWDFSFISFISNF